MPDAGFPAPVHATGFAALLRGTRLAGGLTQDELAARAGIGVRTLRELERGRALRPQRSTVRLLADALGLTGTVRAEFVAEARRPRPSQGPAGGAALLPRLAMLDAGDDSAASPTDNP